MAFNSKILILNLCLLLGLSSAFGGELTLAEQKEKSLEERYRLLLAFANMGDLQARKDHHEALLKAKKAWDLQRAALGKPVYEFREKELEKPIAQNDLDASSKNLTPLNGSHQLGSMHPVEFPSEWIETKIAALNYLINIPAQREHYILSSSTKVELQPPQELEQWKLWQFFAETNQWEMLKSGSNSTSTEVFPHPSQISSYAFFKPLKHPSKLSSDDITFTQVELDLDAPVLKRATWNHHHQGGIQLSWSFEDQNFNEGEVIVLLEQERLERSKILIQQPRNGQIILEPQFARWMKSVSFISYDLAGHVSHHHFKITH